MEIKKRVQSQFAFLAKKAQVILPQQPGGDDQWRRLCSGSYWHFTVAQRHNLAMHNVRAIADGEPFFAPEELTQSADASVPLPRHMWPNRFSQNFSIS
ncbi:MAG: hypothetical protein AAGB07_14170 [Pseudomonadota bacterium]